LKKMLLWVLPEFDIRAWGAVRLLPELISQQADSFFKRDVGFGVRERGSWGLVLEISR